MINERRNSLYNYAFVFFMIGVVFLFAFVLDTKLGYLWFTTTVFYISGSDSIMLLMLCFAFAVFTGAIRFYSAKITIPLLFLLLRLPVVLIPSLYNVNASSGRVLAHILIPLSFFIGTMSYSNRKTFFVSIIALSIIVTLQVIYTSTTITIPMYAAGGGYAHFMRVPFAPSNAISGLLSPCIWLVVGNRHIIKPVRIVLIVFFAVGAILTSSIGAIMIIVIMVGIYLMKNNIRDLKSRNAIKAIVILFVILGVSLFAYTILRGRETLHGRAELFANAMRSFFKYPIFGIGMDYTYEKGLFTGTHNLLLECLRESGIVGFFLMIIPLGYVLLPAWKNRGSTIGGISNFMLAIFLHMMIDGFYFSYNGDFLFWMSAGIVYAHSLQSRHDMVILSKNLEIPYKNIV